MNKFIKKCTVLMLILLSVLMLGACKKDPNIRLNEQIDKVTESLLSDTSEEITDDIVLLTQVGDVKISWISSNSEVLSTTGKVNRQEQDVEVELYAFLSLEELKTTKVIKFTVLGLNDSPDIPDLPSDLIPYYHGAEDLTGLSLKSFLHDLIDDHQAFSYSYARDALKETDEDPSNPNNVILFYTGRSQAKSTYGSGVDQWNREHVWAKSHGDFGTSMPAGTDLHHLRPTDASVNSTRSSLDFDEGGKKVNDVYGVGSTYCYYDSDSFEPRDEVKGDVARIIFYMAVRYEGDKYGEPDLELNDYVNNGSRPYMGKLSILLKWNKEDPVDDFERNRNEVIFSYQRNRNPFIDYPHFADLILG